jgi:hypothetical protein
VNTSDKSEVLRKVFGLKKNGISNLGYYTYNNEFVIYPGHLVLLICTGCVDILGKTKGV